MFRNALISVSDKRGLIQFIEPLVAKGLRVVSTGGTAAYLKSHGVPVTDISDHTGFPEVMGGRVKTLHPKVHMALLARSNSAEDRALLKEMKVEEFDLVICNLYPFEKVLIDQKDQVQFQDLIENIDIGGPTMLRAAAKNFDRVAVVCDPDDYQWFHDQKEISLRDRQALAAKVFSHVATYDSLIAATLNPEWGKKFSVGGDLVSQLRYGENPQQKASWYKKSGAQPGLQDAKILQGKALSYNNLLDLDACVRLVQDFEHPAAVAVKHNNPCGVGVSHSPDLAIKKALEADPVSVFGGVLAVNRAIDLKMAERLEKIFLECILAPGFEKEALNKFSTKKNLRLLEWPRMMEKNQEFELKSILGGFVLQSKDSSFAPEDWKYLGEMPSQEIIEDLKMAEKVCASLKSNSIAIVAQGQSVGLGMGQVNRVDAVRQAILRMKDFFPKAENMVLASDAFFPFPDSVEEIAKAGIRWVLQPGGSLKDDLVFARAKELNVQMVISHHRHFRH